MSSPKSFPVLSYAALLGVLVGGFSTLYYLILKTGTQWIWQTLPDLLYAGAFNYIQYYAWVLTTIGGFLVGLIVYYWGAPAGLEAAVDEIHQQGRISYQQLPGMLVASLLSLTFGSSAGPESPLVDINGGLGSWLGDRLKLSKDSTRILTFCGVSAALGAFFGSPLGSALLALELPHAAGLEYYEALIPAMVAAVTSFVVFRISTGLTIGGIYQFSPDFDFNPDHLIYAVLLGCVGAAVTALFVLIFRGIQRLIQLIKVHPILLTTLGGLGLGLIAMLFPLTLFYGEEQIQTIIDHGSQMGFEVLLGVAIAKMITTSLSLKTGFRGGFIFPLFFIGAAVGQAVSLVLPQIPPTVGIICVMAATTVAVMKTPVSIALILSAISHTEMIPVITIATTVGFLLTTRINLISTQRSRISLPRK